MKIRVKNEGKAIIIAFVSLIIVAYIYWMFLIAPIVRTNNFASQNVSFKQSNEDPIFKIKEIMLYSSANGSYKSKGEVLKDLDVHQYTDISITIDNKFAMQDLSNKNSVSELYIDNIKIEKTANKGESALNYKTPYDFGIYKDTIQPTDRIDFRILHTNEDNKDNDFSTPTFFTDCSNPITLGYMNKNVKTNCEITKSNQKIEFNGKLLEAADIPIEDVAYKLSFQIHLKNSLEESYVYTVDLNMPLQDDNSSIYDGYIFKVMNNQAKEYYFLKE